MGRREAILLAIDGEGLDSEKSIVSDGIPEIMRLPFVFLVSFVIFVLKFRIVRANRPQSATSDRAMIIA